MAEIREPAGRGFKIFGILGILFFLALVAGLITTYDTDSDVAALAPAVTTPAPTGSAEVAGQTPVGAVATGGGGMAGDAGVAIPIFVGLVVLTVLATTGIVLRRQEA